LFRNLNKSYYECVTRLHCLGLLDKISMSRWYSV